jgi:proteic killer suppression protein
MELAARNKALRDAITSEAESRRYFGAVMSRKLYLRLAALRAARSLADFWPPKSGPERCHELKGDMAGVFSVDLQHPYRLLFKPMEAEKPVDRNNEEERWSRIESIELLCVEDTHG